MATTEVVKSIFGLSPLDIQKARQKRIEGLYSSFASKGGREGFGGVLGLAIGQGISGLLDVNDPELQKAKDMADIQKQVSADLSPEDISNPNIYFSHLADLLSKKGYGTEASQILAVGADEIQKWDKSQQEAKLTQLKINETEQDIQDREGFKSDVEALQLTAAARGTPPTSQEILEIASKYSTADKLLNIAQTDIQKDKYYDFMVKNAERNFKNQVALAEQRGADAKELEAIKQSYRKEIEFLKAKLGTGKGSKSKSGVYERVYGGRIVTSASEVGMAATNLNVLTGGGTTPQTAGLFKDLEGKGVLSAGTKFFGQTVTDSDQQKYEAIMRPVIYNLAQLQGSGQVPRQSQIDNLMKSLVVEPGQKYDAQIVKMGELRQIFEASAEAALVNPALTAEQRKIVNSNVDRLRKAIPFTGQDAILYGKYIKSTKTPLNFGEWLDKNGKGRGVVGHAKLGDKVVDRPVSATGQEWESYVKDIGASIYIPGMDEVSGDMDLEALLELEKEMMANEDID